MKRNSSKHHLEVKYNAELAGLLPEVPRLAENLSLSAAVHGGTAVLFIPSTGIDSSIRALHRPCRFRRSRNMRRNCREPVRPEASALWGSSGRTADME